uniref:Uncharacterized protein n=1 Tax=Nannospalax galili TaxID=1026970 RepID=A0A8C6R5S9_NANGA
LKSENCVENPEHLQPMYIYNPDEENQKLEDSGMKRLESTEVPGIKAIQLGENPLQPVEKPDKSQGNVYSQSKKYLIFFKKYKTI